MTVKSSEVRSGIFVVLALVVLSILVFSVGNFRARFETTSRYTAFLTDAKFLKAHDPVTYGGLRVGEVKRVEVSAERHGHVKVTVEVEQDIPVRVDSTLVLKQDGMLGPKYLEILPGGPASARAAPGAELQGYVFPALTDLTSAVEGPLRRIDRVLAHLDEILGLPENQQNLADVLYEARTLMATLGEQVQKLGALAARTAEKTNEVLGDVQGTIQGARGPLVSTLKNADELTGKLGKTVDELSAKVVKSVDALTARMLQTADHLDRLLQDADGLIVQNNKNIYETIRALRDTAYHMEQATKRIRANPAVLLFGADETAEERRRADETEIRLKGRARRYDKEDPK
jgi:phospholipid/cholesterol/gamma-HCH transport system substrate-binding protein